MNARNWREKVSKKYKSDLMGALDGALETAGVALPEGPAMVKTEWGWSVSSLAIAVGFRTLPLCCCRVPTIAHPNAPSMHIPEAFAGQQLCHFFLPGSGISKQQFQL